MAEFSMINEARLALGLGEEASLAEIKEAFRSLSMRYHPDKCRNEDKRECTDVFKKINNAKDILLDYCANYRYSFREPEVRQNSMDKQLYDHLKRFYDGWFGNLDI